MKDKYNKYLLELARRTAQDAEAVARANSVSASFWGALKVDPDQVFVDRDAAERSAKALRDLLPAAQKG